MLLRSQCISTLSIASGLKGLPERQPHKAVRTTATRNKHCEKLTSRRIINMRPLDFRSRLQETSIAAVVLTALCGYRSGNP